MEPLSDAVRRYIRAIERTRTLESATAELSLHYALKELLEWATHLFEKPIQVVHEPAKTAHGRPDFVLVAHGEPIGYVEAEAYGSDLDNLPGEAKTQNERFIQNLGNFLLTNYTEFRLYQGGTLQAQVRLTTPPTQQQVRDLHNLLEAFLGAVPESPATAHDLAHLLARRTRQLRYALLSALRHDKDSSLINLHRAFSEVLLPDLSYEEFADLYAQTLAYGLFAARLTHPQQRPFVRALASALIPQTNPFLRRLFHQISQVDLAPSIAWIADEIAALLDRTDVAAVLQDFGKRAGREDPVVHFYEDFLSAYDPELREVRGVYYTPESVVGYIVRSIDELLQREFQQPLGLAHEGTLVLDPACGTGSFLFAAVQQIHQTILRKRGAGVWHAYVEQHLLNQLFGFELLAAPYAVAHLKLALQLQQTGYTFREGQRLGIYLTNTLEEAVPKSTLLLGEYISEEANAAVAIKRDKPILVVLGNPPYSGHSANRSYTLKDGKRTLTWIGERIEDYKWVDGEPLQEKNPKWLQDDYVKFIRFAEWRIRKRAEGLWASSPTTPT